ncbi:hypothetical protein BC826DRAFT_1121611 [Russula brevipes]|nr:hypothetical protein BC826DRAFT_1121611 [Russula brevipes]
MTGHSTFPSAVPPPTTRPPSALCCPCCPSHHYRPSSWHLICLPYFNTDNVKSILLAIRHIRLWLLSGIICAVVSHPADSLVSQLGKPQNKGKSLGVIINEVGFGTLATKGLGTRVDMIGTLTGFQWWIYDTFKASMGLGTIHLYTTA